MTPSTVRSRRHRTRARGIERAALVAVLGFAAFEQGIDCHSVPMPKIKVLLEPDHDLTRLDARLDGLALHKPFFGSQPAKIVGAFAGLGLNIGQVALE